MQASASAFHYNPHDDRSDFDRSINPGSSQDVSVFLHTFRNGLRGGVWRDRLDPKLIDVQRMWSMLVVLYDGTPICIAHVDDFDNLGAIELSERAMQMIERHTGRVAL